MDTMRRLAPPVVGLLTLIIAGFPSEKAETIAATAMVDSAPFIPLATGIEFAQTIELPDTGVGANLTDADYCVGIRFGTYARSNSAEIEVSLETSSRDLVERWKFNSSELVDNQHRNFCIETASAPREGMLRVRGVEGDGSSSPTVWLTSDRSIGSTEGGRSMHIRIQSVGRASPMDLIAAGSGGVFLYILAMIVAGYALMPFRGSRQDLS